MHLGRRGRTDGIGSGGPGLCQDAETRIWERPGCSIGCLGWVPTPPASSPAIPTRGSWACANCGNGIHHGNIILGLCAARRGRVSQAKVHLHAAARCPGSPQLNSFGPNMRLAAVLLEQGMRDAVLDYLEACKELWECETTASHGRPFAGPARLDAWADEIRQGKIPDFGPNLAC